MRRRVVTATMATAPSRRSLLKGSGIAAVGTVVAAPTGADAAQGRPTRRRVESFDAAWLFLREDVVGAQAPDHDDAGWRELDLPHDYRIEDRPGGSDDGGATADPSIMMHVSAPLALAQAPKTIGPFTQVNDPTPAVGARGQGWTVGGNAWYRKHFRLDDLRAGERVELRFDGAYRVAEVFINGTELGRNVFGYNPFSHDLTPHLRRGENVIAVRIEDSGATGRWYTGSGIYRHTWLTITGPTRVVTDGIFVTTPLVGRRSRVKTRVEVASSLPVHGVKVRTTLIAPSGRRVTSSVTHPQSIKRGQVSVFETWHTVTDPHLWNVETPDLYTARVEVVRRGVVIDRVDQTFGIRSIAADPGRGLLINGKPVKLRGANVHHDHGPLGAVALDRSEERRIEILKAHGFNAYRTAHNPPNPATLEMCDRLGMLVIDETFDFWDVQNKAPRQYPEFAQTWEETLRTHVRRDRNHPSVIIWSFGNEILTDPQGRGAEIAAVVEELDKSRLTQRGGYYEDPVAGGGPAWSTTTMGDVHYKTDLSAEHAAHPDKIISQSESYPATIYDDWKFEQDHPWAVGNFVWTGWDHIGEAGLGVPSVQVENDYVDTGLDLSLGVTGTYPYPWVLSGSSDLDLIGQPKPQNFWRQVVYGNSELELFVERPLPAGIDTVNGGWTYADELASWTWADVAPGTVVKVRAYTRGDEAELRINGRRVATNPVAESDRCITRFDVPYEPGTLEVIARRKGVEISRKTLETVGEPAALRLRADLTRVTTSRDDLVHVLVEVVDSEGRLVPDAVEKITFDVIGAGTLMGVANANMHNVDSFQRPRRWTYHGQALAVLRPAKQPGMLRLVARGERLRQAAVNIRVELPTMVTQ